MGTSTHAIKHHHWDKCAKRSKDQKSIRLNGRSYITSEQFLDMLHYRPDEVASKKTLSIRYGEYQGDYVITIDLVSYVSEATIIRRKFTISPSEMATAWDTIYRKAIYDSDFGLHMTIMPEPGLVVSPDDTVHWIVYGPTVNMDSIIAFLHTNDPMEILGLAVHRASPHTVIRGETMSYIRSTLMQTIKIDVMQGCFQISNEPLSNHIRSTSDYLNTQVNNYLSGIQTDPEPAEYLKETERLIEEDMQDTESDDEYDFIPDPKIMHPESDLSRAMREATRHVNTTDPSKVPTAPDSPVSMISTDDAKIKATIDERDRASREQSRAAMMAELEQPNDFEQDISIDENGTVVLSEGVEDVAQDDPLVTDAPQTTKTPKTSPSPIDTDPDSELEFNTK